MLYNKSKTTLEDYDEMVTVMENLASYLENNYGKFNGIEEELSTMVKSFYDPKVEERGIEKGIKKSNELLIKLIVKRFGNIPEELKNRIMELPIEKVNEIGESIFDFKSIEDVEKYLL